MGSVDLIRSCLDSLREISDEISDAILYIDSGTREAFQFSGAFPLLLQLGVRSVCGLDDLSPLDAAAGWSLNYVDPLTKIVIITSRLLSDTHRYILRILGTHSTIQSCVVFTSIPEISHSAHIDCPLGPDAFREYETLLTQDYEELVKKGNNNAFIIDTGGPTQLSVSVQHLPMVICPVSSRVFVLPSEGTMTELCLSNEESEESLGRGLPAVSSGQNLDGDDAPSGITLTAHFLYYLADKMDLKLEIFSLGDTSKSIGKTMMDMSSLYDVSRRTKRSAGLLLVDRTVDLLSPCLHGDSFLERILSSLPRQHSTSKAAQSPSKIIKRIPLDMDVPFDTILEEERGNNRLYENVINFISGWNSSQVDDNNFEISPKLSGAFLANYTGASYLESLLDRGAKDGLLLVKKWLLESLKNENLSFSSKVTSQSDLPNMVKIISRDQKVLVRNRGIVKLALAADMANSEPQSSRWDAFVSAERILSVSSADSSQSLSSEIRDFINTSITSQGILSLKDVLLLSMVGYILAGENFPTSVSMSPFSWEEERSIKDAIVDAILEKPQDAKIKFLYGLEKELESQAKKNVTKEGDSAKSDQIDDFDDQWGNWDENEEEEEDKDDYGGVQLKLELRDRVDQLCKFFHKLSSIPVRSPTIREVLVDLSKYESGTYGMRKGLLYKLLSAILSKGDVPGIEYHSSAVGRFFKSGFGRFGLGQAKPNLGDQSVLFIFVVGGINALEAREVMEAITESGKMDTELILGGTTLLTPDDMFDLMLS
ncbi:hypothetical protein LUZ63_005081 [Rhynchospora breviuscula]|uniref:Sec1 family domain-containing protein 2 n=1 Tax=Rhynchospora breviuscula TaxID=2022672 RepID=A0A9Q0HS99_9POAL|nr:hypothetical protein LUZ63_005081 [Rhynchospora breviuscula]